ncbi:hypothetical protein L226DRAFT_573846 [Lentinus tigrinus ALCF2SS1-7]|uniref:uncharacterized protein n=1 Tax=Lentinus tigrinus ALCF2SS1-7 TaxID=1328758 RepID=UPI00116618CA|nr:hypothetical protein L226DRAFT_573846 [Lentinus tigrinus ALCF2SS1-7]
MPVERKTVKSTSAVCQVCGKSYAKKDMSRHQLIHRSDRNQREFVCSLCGHSSLQRSNVANHVVTTHTKDQPQVCTFLGPPVCNLAFQTSSDLSKHKKAVHGEQPDEMYTKQKGKMDKYYKFVLSPEEVWRAGSSPSSSSSASSASSSRRPTPHPRRASPAVPAGITHASVDPLRTDPAYIAQLSAMHPADYSHFPKRIPVEFHSLPAASMPPGVAHPGAWQTQWLHGGVPNAYAMQQPHSSMSQRLHYAHDAPYYGYSAQQW